MKKSLAILLFIIYIAGVSGLEINRHICCHEMATAMESHNQVTPVPKPSSPFVSAKPCCENLHSFFKLNNVLEPSGKRTSFLASSNHLFSPILHTLLWNHNAEATINYLFNRHSHPLSQAFPTFLNHIILLI